jgi:hypothetical protein
VRVVHDETVAPDGVSPTRLSWTTPLTALVDGRRTAEHGGVEELLVTVIGGSAVLVVTGVVIYLYQRSLEKPGGREGLGQVGDMLGGMIDVLEPGHGRARDALREIEHSGPVTPTPDDSDDPIRMLTNPDGTPRAIHLRRPR